YSITPTARTSPRRSSGLLTQRRGDAEKSAENTRTANAAPQRNPVLSALRLLRADRTPVSSDGRIAKYSVCSLRFSSANSAPLRRKNTLPSAEYSASKIANLDDQQGIWKLLRP